MDVDEPNIKTVIWIENKKPFKNNTTEKKETEPKEHKKRVITQHKNWNFKTADLQPDAQLDLAKTLILYIANDHIITDAKLLMVSACSPINCAVIAHKIYANPYIPKMNSSPCKL